MRGNKKTVQYYYYKTISKHKHISSFTLKALVSDPSLWFHRVGSRKRPALAASTFLNSRGGRLRELRLYMHTSHENYVHVSDSPFFFNRSIEAFAYNILVCTILG